MKLCSIDGCDQQSRTRGWCQRHYGRFRRYGDPNHPVQKTSRKPRLCSLKGCGKAHEGHGLCAMHLWRKRRGWTDLDVSPKLSRKPEPVEPVEEPPAACVEDGCGAKPHPGGTLRCTEHMLADLRRRRDSRRQKSFAPDPARVGVKQARQVAA